MSFQPIDLLNQHRSAFTLYLDLLLRWNRKINLTAITEPEKVWHLHFLDSLFVVPLLDRLMAENAKNVSRETFSSFRVLDIGAGAGFPGIPIKIVRPQIQVTLVDSVKKKCDFMKETIRTLNLQDIQVLHHHLDPNTSLGSFNCIVSRAAFKLKDIICLSLPHLSHGGSIIAMKSENIQSEIDECHDIIQQHQLGPIQESIYQLPSSQQNRKIVMISIP